MKTTSRASFLYSIGVIRFAHFMRYWWRYLRHGRVDAIGGVRVIINHHGRVVLVRHWYAPGVWTLPGGGIERNESVDEAAIREVREETGFVAERVEEMLGVYDGSHGKGDQVAVVIMHNPTGSMRFFPNSEIMERGLFDFDQLPENISPAHRRRIVEYLRGDRDVQGVRW